MASKNYTVAQEKSVAGTTVYETGGSMVKVKKSGSIFIVSGDQSEIDKIDALGTWTAQ